MKIEYSEWIKKRFPTHEAALAMCASATQLMVKDFPELIRVRGWVNSVGISKPRHGAEHWWCKTADGEIVDPTAAQFPENLTYIEFREGVDIEPIGKCMNCGAQCYAQNPETGEPIEDVGTCHCSEECRLELEGYYSCKFENYVAPAATAQKESPETCKSN